MRPRNVVGLAGFACLLSALGADGPPSAEALEHFEKKVRPVLAERCWKCHGAEAGKGGLRLHAAAALAAGGDTGPVVVAGNPDESLLVEVVRYQGELKMPPKGKLPDEEVAAIVEWVRSGAHWPAGDTAEAPSAVAAKPAAKEPLWSLQPVSDPAPPSAAPGFPDASSPIDRFLLAALQKNGLRPAPAADKRTLIRRATFDLTGLPPTPEEIDAYLNDTSPDAFARVIDRLLASPHYGERWARHWLDLARYADSNGMDENVAYANAYRYRDYVVSAFNRDKPFNQFVREQVAGDLISASGDEQTDLERLVATGFLVIGPKMLAEDDPVKMEMDIVDEQVDTVGKVFLGLSLGCARCHDHKFDPIPTADYYSLAGIFKSTTSMANHKVVAMWNERPLATGAELAQIEAHKNAVASQNQEIAKRVERAKAELRDEMRTRFADLLLTAWAQEEVRGLKASVLAVAKDSSVPDALVREAEAFDQGNVLVTTTGYGEGIGVILNKGDLPNFTEYGFELPADGVYQVELRHAAAEPRAVRVLVNGARVATDAAASVTGSWNPDTQAWSAAGLVLLKAGHNVVRLERDGPFPHFDKVALVRRDLPDGLPLDALKSTEEIGRERSLNPRLIEHWSGVVKAAAQDTSSVFRAWRDRDALPAQEKELLLGEPVPATPEALARRYQDAFEEARGADAAKLGASPALAALRKLIDDDKGPFGLTANPEALFSPVRASEVREARDALAALEKSAPPIREAMSVQEGKPTNLRIHIRGNHMTLGDEVPRQFPRAIPVSSRSIDMTRSGRLELADWLVREDQPLTARVIVNRIWASHFGEGLVRSPDNFGRLGEHPDHPELLDWLARRFVESGWSVKAMHRLIMLSNAYQMRTDLNPTAVESDPENRLLWRMNRRRLEAEAIRDALLAVSGELETTMGGSVLPTKNHAYVNNTGGPGSVNYAVKSRSIYLPVIRSGLYDVFQAFDFADPSTTNGRRVPTTVAPQALFMLNDGLVLRTSEAFARKLLAQPDLDDAGRIRLAYLTAYGRPPLERETARAQEYLQRFDAELQTQSVDAASRPLRAWQALAQAIFASSEFVFVD